MKKLQDNDDLPCECNLKNEHGDYINEPCCAHTGICTAAYTEDDISNCICCGAEMYKEKETGIWRHHSQMELPINERFTIHAMENKPKP